MQKVDYGRLEERMKDTGSRDEVSVLGRKFNDMMTRIETLISDVYVSDLKRKELELRRREAEMYALQAQVNPHYLFNTLNALRGSLLEKGDRDNARIVMLLADSFRNVLRQEGHLIRLREECKIVETYLGIQQFRYGERMQYFIDVPELLQDVHIPRLALQTVVENAVIHAVDRSNAKTTIVVKALDIEDDGYTLTVSDDGSGMPSDRLADVSERIGREMDEEEPVNLGLRNTHQRLLALYGKGFGVTVSSTLQKGTSVTLRLRKQPLLDPDD
jgi:sensor histidine kinase YesM